MNNNNDDIVIVELNRSRFCQILCNLLYNVVKFTNEGSITIIVE